MPSRKSRSLQSPLRPIGIRDDYIAESKTRLYMKPKGSPYSETDYTIRDEVTNSTLFTVTGRKCGLRSCREFRDESGLPLFELHRKFFTWNRPWTVTLPGSDEANIVGLSLRRSFGCVVGGNMNLIFENAISINPGDFIKLKVHKISSVVTAIDVMDGDRKVIDVRVSTKRNRKVTNFGDPHRNFRPILDIRIAEGVDMTLAALVAVIVSDWIYGEQIEVD